MENCGPLAETYLNSFPFVSNVVGISLAIFAPITVFLNALLMASFIATKQVHLNTTNFLIMCVSLSDLLNGAVVMPILASILYKIDLKKSCDIFNPAQATTGFFTTLSAILTVLIAVDRYLNMNPNLESSSRCAKVFQRPNIYCLVVVITVGVLIYSFTNTYTPGFNIKSMQFGWLNLINSLMAAFGVSAVAILYTKGYIRIRNFTDTSPIYKDRNGNNMRPQYVRNLYRSVLVLVVLMMLIYVPVCIAQIAATINVFIGSKEFTVVHTCYHFTGLLLYLNCTINSIVILCFNKTAKQWILKRIRCAIVMRRRETIDNISNAAIVGRDCERLRGILLTNVRYLQ